MKTLIGLLTVLIVVTACTTASVVSPRVTAALQPTIDAMEVQTYINVMNAQSTLTAYSAAATAQAAQAQREQYTAQATATAQAQAAHATATMQAAQATATVAAVEWAQQATATAVSWESAVQGTAVAQEAQATVQAATSAQAQLELRRQQMVAPVTAFGPWLLLGAAFAMILWGGYRLVIASEVRLRTVQRDARGDAPLLVLGKRGGVVVYDADKAFGPATVIEATVTQPQLTDADRQERVTERDQMVDLAHRGTGSSHKPAALPVATADNGLRSVRPLRNLTQAVKAGALPAPLAEAIDAEWHTSEVTNEQ